MDTYTQRYKHREMTLKGTDTYTDIWNEHTETERKKVRHIHRDTRIYTDWDNFQETMFIFTRYKTFYFLFNSFSA